MVRRWWKTISRRETGRDVTPDAHPTKALNARDPSPAYNYPYVKGKPPAFPNSASLDQDGSDFSYFTTVKVGSGGKEFHMLVDTGASESWVMSAKCTTRICSMHNTLGPADSSSLVTSDSTWNVTYGTGNVSGTLANDVFVFAALNVTMAFGLAEQVSSEFENYPIDGILGLGRTKPGEYNSRILLEALRSQSKLKSNVVGINLQRAYDNTNDGVINFGEWDKSRFVGDLTWVNTTNTTGPWEIRVDDAGSGGKNHQFVNRTALLDTGSSFVLLPPDDAKKLHETIPGVRQNGETFLVPCTTSTEIHFTFGGVVFPISPDDYVGRPIDSGTCNSNIVGRQTFGPRQWLLGDVFLKNVYSIFDWDQNRVGG